MKISYLGHIDGLRAIAVLLIIFFHLGFGFLGGGYIGVDVFFVISGFLITRLIIHEIETTGDFSFKNFYLRRARRLLPALFFTLFCTLLFSFLLFAPQDFQRVGDTVWRAAIAISNFQFWRESDYFDVSSFYKPLLHTWSLGVEEQFYLIWPLTLVLLLKLKHIRTYLPVLLIGVASYVLVYLFQDGNVSIINERIGHFENGKSSTFFLLPFRVFEFTIGALTVWISKKTDAYKNDGFAFLGFLMIIIPGVVFSESLVHPSMLNIIPCIGAALLIHSGSSTFASKILSNTFFKKTGQYSYSLYLVHWPLIVFYRYYKHNSLDLIDQGVILILTYVLAYLIGELIERPFRYGKSKFYLSNSSYFVAACLLFVTIVFFTGQNINENKGWIWRISPEQQVLIKDLGDPKEFHLTNFGGKDCANLECLNNCGCLDNGGETICEKTDAIFIGDSHAQQYGSALEKILVKEHGIKLQLIYQSLIFLPDFRRNDMGDDYQEMFEWLFRLALRLGKSNPNAVYFISQSWEGRLGASSVKMDSTSDYTKVGYDSVGIFAAYEKLKKLKLLLGDHKLVVFGGVPGGLNGEPPLNALLRPGYFKSNVRNLTSGRDSLGLSFEINELFATRIPELDGVYFINPYDALCENNECFSVIDNKVVYSDNAHLSGDGAEHIIRYFEDEIMQFINDEKEKEKK